MTRFLPLLVFAISGFADCVVPGQLDTRIDIRDVGPESRDAIPMLQKQLLESAILSVELLDILGADAQMGSVVPLLVENLSDDRVLPREAAARALGRFGQSATEAIPELKKPLDDDYASVRDAARKSV